ncbi:MAG: D-alanine--D-alanine ligase [Bilophila sp.]
MKVLLLAGGWSSEREVSLRGGDQIATALESRGHSVTRFDPAKEFEHLMDVARQHDVAFINLHGAAGEDGLVQALLDRVNCPYQGAGPAGSFLALHKAAARQIFRDAGLRIPDGVFLPRHPGPGWKPPFDFPLFVKSNTGGSSINLSRVVNEEELAIALNALFSTGEEALVEKAISGREVTCGILGDKALAPILIVSKGLFFDYHNKYAADGAEEICPAPLSAAITANVQDCALRAHVALGLKGYSRADFILQDDGALFLLEVNTIPGMTATSLVPREAAVIGLSFADLAERLLQLAVGKE